MPEQKQSGSAYGKISHLNLQFCRQQKKTILEDVYFTAPFKVMQPFLSNTAARFMILSASAGIMAGDRQDIDIYLKKGTTVELTAQSYEKIHKMIDGEGRRSTRITLEKDTLLFYAPQPVIPFAGSVFTSDTVIHLTDNTSKLFFSEILSSGRTAYDERFLYKKYSASVKIYEGNDICYFENSRYLPAQQNLNGFGSYEGYTHLATILLFNFTADDSSLTEKIRQILDMHKELDGGVSCTENKYLCIKSFASSGQSLVNFIDSIKKLLKIDQV